MTSQGESAQIAHFPERIALEHRENCLCSKPARAVPPRMMDERNVELNPPIIIGLLAALDYKLVAMGSPPMVRTSRSRYNAAGEPIGPEMLIRSCDALLYWRVEDRVLNAIERGAERQR
jgi:hypothetical protein